MPRDKNGRDIKVGDVVRRGILNEAGQLVADEVGHLPIPSMRVMELIGERNIKTDVRTNGELPPIYLASLCEVIST